MEPNLIDNFMKALIEKTLNKELIWNSFTDDTYFDGERASDLLGQDEFHQIYYFESYVLQKDDGRIFLVSEFNESGRDWKYNTEGFAIYIQPKPSQPLERILFDTPDVYRLKNAIELNIKTDVSPEVNDFLHRFFQ